MDDKFHFTGCIFIWSDGWSRPTWILQNPSSNLSFSWIPGATHGPFRYEIQLKYLTFHDIRIFCSLCNLSLNQWDSYITGGGLFTLFVSMIGLVATSRRSPCLLRFYAFMLLVAFLVLLGGITCSVKVYLFDYDMAYLIFFGGYGTTIFVLIWYCRWYSKLRPIKTSDLMTWKIS